MRIFIGGGRKLSPVDGPDERTAFARQAVEMSDAVGEAVAELDGWLPVQVPPWPLGF